MGHTHFKVLSHFFLNFMSHITKYNQIIAYSTIQLHHTPGSDVGLELSGQTIRSHSL